ncbi:MAG: hypothetical protein ACLUIQ_05825 [Dialister invisus]
MNGIRNRMPYQTNGTLRKAINAGQINYFDLHLSHVAQQIREGFFTNVKGEHVTGPDFAVIEACKIVKRDGEIGIVTTTAIGNSPYSYPRVKSHHRSQYYPAGSIGWHG